jgi:hypothetical protein
MNAKAENDIVWEYDVRRKPVDPKCLRIEVLLDGRVIPAIAVAPGRAVLVHQRDNKGHIKVDPRNGNVLTEVLFGDYTIREKADS